MPRYFSWNAYRSYRDCSLRYKNIYILKKAHTVMQDDYNLVYGSVMHEVTEAFYKQALWKLRKDCGKKLLELAREIFKKVLRESKIIWTKPKRKTPEELLVEILADVPKIIEAVKKYSLLSKTSYSEYSLKAKLANHLIGGRADLLLPRKEGLTLIDGKGSKNKDSDHREQLLFYVLCYYLSKKEVPKFSGVWYFRQAYIEWHSFTAADLKRLRDMILDAKDSMNKGIFEPTAKRENCFWCEYKNTCLVQKDHLETPYGEIVEAFF